VSKRSQNIVENRTGGRSAPTTVNSSVRTREYLATAEIERLMADARKSSRYGHRDETPKAFHALFGRIGERAKMPFPVHPHMLRHGCGYALANAGHDTRALQAWLGHKNIQHTVRYTELAPDRFKNFWR
jgi:site-specific recombinase XerD